MAIIPDIPKSPELNLTGDFAVKAEQSTAAANKLGASLDKLAGYISKLSEHVDRTEAAAQLKKEEAAAKAAAQAYRDLIKAQSAPKSGAGQLAKGFGDSLGSQFDKVADSIRGKAASLFPGAASELEKGGGFLSFGGAALADSAGLAVGAASKLAGVLKDFAVKTGELLVQGFKLSVAESTKAEVEKAILDKITGGKGKMALDLAGDIAMDIGIDDDKALADVKRLLQAKFSEKEIPVLIKIATGIDAVQGAGKGDAFLKKLETINLSPKVKSKDIDGLAKLGIDTKDVYDNLAKKLGISVPAAMAKVKAGTVDTKDALDAIGKSGEKAFGGIADTLGNSVPGLLMKLQTGVKGLFDGMDLGPVKGALKSVLEVLKSPAGEGLKESISKLFSTIGKVVFGPFEGKAGQKKIEAFVDKFAAGLDKMSAAIEKAGPAIKFFEDVALMAAAGAPHVAAFLGGALGLISDLIGYIDTARGYVSAFFALFDSTPDLTGQGNQMGTSLVSGFTSSIEAGASSAIQAAINMARGAVDGAKGALDAHSPSREFEALGEFSKAGLVAPMNDNADVKAAGADMGKAAIDGTASAGGSGGAGAVGKAGAAGGGGDTYTIIVNPPAGMTSAQGKALADDISYQIHLINQRRAAREGRERGAA